VKIFSYECPNSIEEAISILAGEKGEAKVLAGGTDLINMMKTKTIAPKTIVSMKNLTEHRGIDKQNGEIRIGAFCTLRDIAESELLDNTFQLLSRAAGQIGSLQIRSRGTIGGNICNASPAADTSAPLLVLDAKAEVQGSGGLRLVPLKDFFRGPGETALAYDEILTGIILPKPRGKGSGLYIKLGRRRAMDLATVGVAVYLTVESSNEIISDIRIAISSAAPRPFRAFDAESILKGQSPEKQLIEKAASMVSEASNPITDVRASKEYRKETVRVLTSRAIENTLSDLNVESE
jgi:carbon-monoxide dehydrogenase medium subunit